ncbi:RNA polymerase sigma factor [Candidatus Arthromitus sp. SFB-co]|nr:RNA polymerase sigma factor [Candidatus Arthromitus sp. SFB-co]
MGKIKTQKEIAKKLNISRSYVSRIEKKALSKLNKELLFKK